MISGTKMRISETQKRGRVSFFVKGVDHPAHGRAAAEDEFALGAEQANGSGRYKGRHGEENALFIKLL